MIVGLTEEQFNNLPVTSLRYPCDKCGKRHDYGSLMRDIADYTLKDCQITGKETHTALYLCGACHWQITCEYQRLDKDLAKELDTIKENEARWLLKVSKLSVQELACKIGVSRQAYYKWLRGRPIIEKHRQVIREVTITFAGITREGAYHPTRPIPDSTTQIIDEQTKALSVPREEA